MSTQPDDSTASTPRGRGRGKSRGGLGKYLRARGRGHRGGGRPAEFGKRLVLEGEEPAEDDPESEEAQEEARRYSRRQLGTNADRYKEEEPELDSDGEPIVEPQVDLSAFLAKQRLADDATPNPSSMPPPDEEELADIDRRLTHIGSASARPTADDRKGKAQQIEWDCDLEEMQREKEAADAQRALKDRFRARAAKQQPKTVIPSGRMVKPTASLMEAPPLPTDGSMVPKKPKDEMEDFLDDLLG